LVGELAANLVDNATRYGAKYVLVGTRRQGARSVLEVVDDGPGIPAEERGRIFERFHRVDRTDAGGGSGLGLPSAREIAQPHDATIGVDDGPTGRGVRISVSFP